MIKLYVANDEYLQIITPKKYSFLFLEGEDFIRLNSEIEVRDLVIEMIESGAGNYFCFVNGDTGRESELITVNNVASLPYKYI